MNKDNRQRTAANLYMFKWQRATLIFFLLLMCCVLASCQTVKPKNSVLKDLQAWSAPAPPHRLSPPREQVRAKAVMAQWIEQYLKDEYRVADQRFVLTESGFADSAALGSHAGQYVEHTLSGVPQPGTWFGNEYRLLLWKLSEESPRYIAVVLTRDFVSGTRERTLVGYFQLVPSPPL